MRAHAESSLQAGTRYKRRSPQIVTPAVRGLCEGQCFVRRVVEKRDSTSAARRLAASASCLTLRLRSTKRAQFLLEPELRRELNPAGRLRGDGLAEERRTQVADEPGVVDAVAEVESIDPDRDPRRLVPFLRSAA